jgi:poly-gamma-glutamate synthesis protein (capsule biosynthesis protein)
VDRIQAAHAAFTNVEFVTPHKPLIPAAEYGGIHLGMPPFVLDELNKTGFNLYSIANNHSLDFTLKGLRDTLEELRKRGMAYAGAGDNLGDARSPAYIDTPAGRVALVAAASSYVAGAQAGEVRTDFPGRPGINPLRQTTEYALPPDYLDWLKEIDEVMGTAEVARKKEAFGLQIKENPDAYEFLGRNFVEEDSPGVRTKPNERDMKEITRWLSDAARQADFVVMSLHCHEGQNGDINNHYEADFIREAAHKFIDAGADVFVGHGPHVLRGIEIYQGKPIFYSLGNFIFMCENLLRLPADMYELYKLPPDATPADIFDFESRDEAGSPKAFHASLAFWQTVLPICRFQKGTLVDVELHPVTLQLDSARTQRGVPGAAPGKEGQLILEQLAELSAPNGTEIAVELKEGIAVGQIRL